MHNLVYTIAAVGNYTTPSGGGTRDTWVGMVVPGPGRGRAIVVNVGRESQLNLEDPDATLPMEETEPSVDGTSMGSSGHKSLTSVSTQWCHECRECARSKTQPNRPKGKLQKVITGASMDIVAIDILSGLPVTPEGYKYILVVWDYFTKYSRAFPLVDAEASTCMRAIYDGFFALFGLPRQNSQRPGEEF